jgi:hypothetical protein
LDIGNTVHGGCVIRTHRGSGLDYRGIKQMMVTQSKAIEALLSKTEKEKQTNFQRITASPEALAEFIIDKLQYCKRPVCPICPVWKKCDGVSKDAFVKWLKQESE